MIRRTMNEARQQKKGCFIDSPAAVIFRKRRGGGGTHTHTHTHKGFQTSLMKLSYEEIKMRQRGIQRKKARGTEKK